MIRVLKGDEDIHWFANQYKWLGKTLYLKSLQTKISASIWLGLFNRVVKNSELKGAHFRLFPQKVPIFVKNVRLYVVK